MFLKFESRIQTLEFMIHVKWTELRIHKKKEFRNDTLEKEDGCRKLYKKVHLGDVF